MAQISFIGAGNMATAIIKGLLAQGQSPSDITATSIDADALKQLSDETGIQVTTDNREAIAGRDLVVMAVKPQVMKTVCEGVADLVQAHQPVVMSVAAGLTLESLDHWLGGQTALVRCMPNTPALVGAGAAGLYANAQVNDQGRQHAEAVMAAVGLAVWVDREDLLDAVTAVSGSGPAYFFLFVEALEQAGIQQGLAPQVARQLAMQTALGAGRMLTENDLEPAELRRRVTSPGGTTEQAINTFIEGGLGDLVQKAADAAAQRARELAASLGN